MKLAETSSPINEMARRRWSPRAFSDKPVEPSRLRSLLEAARWSASAMNEQPWRFIIGMKNDETWQKIFETLAKGNQIWAKHAPVLMVAIGKTTFTQDGSSSTFFVYDTGQAVAHLSLEALNQGLFVHQMGGFTAERISALFGIPDDFRPLTVIAIGHIGSPDQLPENLKKRELDPRTRKHLEEIVFSGNFGKKAKLLES